MYSSSSGHNLFQRICRVCLQTTIDSVNLFDGSSESKEILDKVNLCFQTVLRFEVYLPHLLCRSCIEELNAANKFRGKCLTFEQRFAAIAQVKVEVENLENITTTVPNSERDNSVKEIVDHISIQQCGTESNVECDLCKKVLKSKSSLAKHITSMHKKRKHVGAVSGFGSTRRYHCTTCPYSTPHSQTLVNHMRRHDGVRPYVCQCGKAFTQSSSFLAHQKTHSNTTYFTCTVCGRQFKHAYSLKKHLHVHESGTFSCNICNKISKSKQTLQDHLSRHYNIKNYNCEGCGDTFVTSSELTSHRRKHNLDKKIECYFCGYKTHTKKNLILHLKRHTGDKQFKCDLCDSIFYTQGDVKRHHRVHTHKKPYGCPTCTQRFAYSTSLNKHMLTVHGVHYKWGDVKHKEIQR